MQQAHELLHAYIDGLGPTIFAGLLSPAGVVVAANRPALLAAGLRPEDVLGKPFDQTPWWTHSPEAQRQLREAIQRASRGEPSRYEVQIRAAGDHQLIDVDFSLQLLRDEHGEVIYLIPSATVITERKQTEEALRASNENFRLLADNITDAFWVRSPDLHQLHYISPAFERIWGRSAESLYRAPEAWIGFVVPEDRDRVGVAFAGLTNDVPTIDLEYRIVRPDGEVRTVRARGFQVRDPSGRLIRLVGTVIDITDKCRLESEALRAQRMESIGTLAGGIAHDLNNVLSPILLSIAMLREQVREEETLSLLDTLQGSAQHGAELVRQVLSFARGVGGDRVTVNPVHLMGDLLKVMRDTFAKSIEVRFAPAPGLWTVNGDPTQMHQVFLNLCVNAMEAMPNGGTLTIGMENIELDRRGAGRHAGFRPGAFVRVRVGDSGGGIPPELRERIFEPFFTTKGLGKGTGLGLSTTLAIIKSHGGFVALESTVGRGTRFDVYLPAITTPASGAALTDLAPAPPRGAGELILLVDDEEAIRKIARRMLERSGYRVLLASEGAEAITLYTARHAEIALVVTDMAMPVMDGPALIAALVALNPQVRIIGTSGLTSDGGVARAVAAGIRQFLAKPYTSGALLTVIHEVLQDGPVPVAD